MELSAELFESTVRALKGDPVEQRQHPRAPARYRLKIVPYKQPGMTTAIDVWTRDISRGGIGVVSPVRFKVGAKFVVGLPRAEGGMRCLVCTVKNCSEQAKGVYVIGSAFEEVVPAAAAPAGVAVVAAEPVSPAAA
jgi:hypothetical protein